MEGGIPPIPEGYGYPAASVMKSFTQFLMVGGGLIGSTAVTLSACEGFDIVLVIPLRIRSLTIKAFKDPAVVN
jgi:hypothetical protein